MSLAKMTPIHVAIAEIDDSIKRLRQAKMALIATLPVEKRKKKLPGQRFLVHPITGEKGYY